MLHRFVYLQELSANSWARSTNSCEVQLAAISTTFYPNWNLQWIVAFWASFLLVATKPLWQTIWESCVDSYPFGQQIGTVWIDCGKCPSQIWQWSTRDRSANCRQGADFQAKSNLQLRSPFELLPQFCGQLRAPPRNWSIWLHYWPLPRSSCYKITPILRWRLLSASQGRRWAKRELIRCRLHWWAFGCCFQLFCARADYTEKCCFSSDPHCFFSNAFCDRRACRPDQWIWQAHPIRSSNSWNRRLSQLFCAAQTGQDLVWYTLSKPIRSNTSPSILWVVKLCVQIWCVFNSQQRCLQHSYSAQLAPFQPNNEPCFLIHLQEVTGHHNNPYYAHMDHIWGLYFELSSKRLTFCSIRLHSCLCFRESNLVTCLTPST